ncbi:hypothetical protein [uncultured Hymenobacter sp.]|uniref:hypothetical protein n=1 Tax=uncultured Hymenobacter sp. TaxID=170016 RepID=UPI0035CAC044
MMKPLCLLLSTLTACERVKDAAKATVHKTGEVVGSSATVLADGVATGAARAAARGELSAALRGRGLQLGKISTGPAAVPTPSAPTDPGLSARPTTNRLTLYVIFNQVFADTITVRLFTSENLEYGRRRVFLRGHRDEARPVDVVFDPRTDFELGTKVVVE